MLAAVANDPAAPCCDGLTMEMMSTAFVSWRQSYRSSSACADTACPEQPPTRPPPGCAQEPRCVASRCTDACGQAPPPAPSTTVSAEAAPVPLGPAPVRADPVAPDGDDHDQAAEDAAREVDRLLRQALDQPGQDPHDAVGGS